MRLIDADESVQHLKEDAELALEIKESGIYAGLYNAMEDINKQQTAYDIDKVIAQIESIPSRHNSIDNEYQRGCADGAAWIKKLAIEIVKACGKYNFPPTNTKGENNR